MRILLFSGKGGVGKTSLAAATGVKLADLNYRTLVLSIDPAHSLADAFDLDTELFHAQTSDPLPINDRLSVQELNIQKEIKRHWQEISSYVSAVLRTTGISGVEAEELAILPGMEDPRIPSVRLVTNAEKMVVRETQRAFVYFSLHGLTVGAVLVNRLLPAEVMDAWFNEWHTSQDAMVHEIEEYFAPVPVKKVPLFSHEVLGKRRLEDLARVLYAEGED